MWKINRDIEDHQKNVLEAFPFLQELSPHHSDGDILYPSTFSRDAFENPSLIYFGEIELQARVAHGHDVLDRVRKKCQHRGLAQSLI
jgi:hypothetical protein